MSPEFIEEHKPKTTRSLNAYRHGLTGQVYVQTPADERAYMHHCDTIHRSLAPVGGMEVQLAQAIADDRWRMNSAGGWEKAILADGITDPDTKIAHHEEIDSALAHGRTWMDKGKSLALLSLYESRFQRRIEKNLKMLQDLQARREAAREKIIEEINLLSELAEFEGTTYDPLTEYPVDLLPSQFDFSIAQLARAAHYRRRVEKAKTSRLAA